MLTLFLSGLAFLIWLNVGFTSLKIFSDPIKPLNSGKKEIKPKKNFIESEGLWLNYKDPFGVKVRIPNSKGIFKMTSKKRPESREKKNLLLFRIWVALSPRIQRLPWSLKMAHSTFYT